MDAIDSAITNSSRQKSKRVGDAKRAENENDKMDRKGGGPVKWQKFYGITAEKFYYHPTETTATYHTATMLGPQSGQMSSRTSAPFQDSPPQFDYIYKANENAKARALEDVKSLKNKMDALLERRAKLEAEQSALWCEIAFHAVSHYDLHKKPLYRFEPLTDGVDTASRQHVDTIRAAVLFMRLALSIIDEAQKDQAKTFSTIKAAVSAAREKLDDGWLRLAVETTDKKTTQGKFVALAKRLDDMASNLSDSYEVAIDGDKEKDQIRKETFRGMLQESLVNYAQVVLALDEMSVVMRDEWKIKPDLDKPFAIVMVAAAKTSATESPQQEGKPAPKDEPKAVAAGRVVYLSDLKETSKEFWEYIPGYGFGKNGKYFIGKGQYTKIVLGGKESPKGIFCHPKGDGISKITYDLKGRAFNKFLATVGVCDERKYGPHTPLIFEVWGDGELLWKSEPVKQWGQPQDCAVDLPKVSKLELKVNCPGDGSFALAVWCEPRLTQE